jgi:hypothetical protein
MISARIGREHAERRSGNLPTQHGPFVWAVLLVERISVVDLCQAVYNSVIEG